MGKFVQSFQSGNKKASFVYFPRHAFYCSFFFLLFQRRVNIASKALNIDLVFATHISDHEKITSLTIKILVSIIGADDIHFKILCKFYAKNIGDFSTGCLKVNFCN